MIITESFVWINYPKTASTFVREALKDVYACRSTDIAKKWRMRNRRMEEKLLPEMRPGSGERRGSPTPHGTVSQIPESFRHLPVVSSYRSPVGRYLSLYNYGDWKKPDQYPDAMENIKVHFSEFPNLGLNEFIRFVDRYYGNVTLHAGEDKVTIGPLSADFLRFFTLPSKSDVNCLAFDSWAQIERDLGKVTFLDSSNINQELTKWLLKFRFPKKDIRFLEEKAASNVSNKRRDGHELDNLAVEKIWEKEWLLALWANIGAGNLSEALKAEAVRGARGGE